MACGARGDRAGATGKVYDDPVTASLERWNGWKKIPQEPVIKAGELIERGLWNDPSVTKEGSEYVMYVTSSTKEMFKPPVLPFRLVSADGMSWKADPAEPLLNPAETGFPSSETPSVVRFGDLYHMFYTGVHGEITERLPVPRMEIAHAVSDDGIRWRADPPGAVLRATGNAGDWNGFLIGEPGAVVFKDRIYLYFAAVGTRPRGRPPQRHTLGLVTTLDGKVFDAPRQVLAQSELYPPERGYAGYSTPSASVYQGSVYLFFDVVVGEPKWRQVALHFAVSEDGLSFRQARLPLLTREAQSWTAGEVRAPSVVFDGDRVQVWYGGHGDVGRLIPAVRGGGKSREFGIGYAETNVEALTRALDPPAGGAQPLTGNRTEPR